MDNKVWLITGCSSGFGRVLAQQVMHQNGKVIACVRDASAAKELATLGAYVVQLDVTCPFEELRKVLESLVSIFGKIDVLVNNAGFVLQGAIEECTPEETFDQFNTNVFGPLNLIRSVLPHMKTKNCGLIINIGSMASYSSVPGAGLYCGSKAAIRQISEALQKEVAEFGIQVTVVEPGFFRTPLLKNMVVHKNSDYSTSVKKTREFLESFDGKQPGDPSKIASEIIRLSLDNFTKAKAMPSRISFGNDAYNAIKDNLMKMLEELESWKEICCRTDF